MEIILIPLVRVILAVINLYMMVIFISVILSWLITFNVVNLRNGFVYMVWNISRQLTEPALMRIRRYLPDLGGVDLSPIVLLLGLWFIEQVLYGIVASSMSAPYGYSGIPTR